LNTLEIEIKRQKSSKFKNQVVRILSLTLNPMAKTNYQNNKHTKKAIVVKH